MWVGASPGVRPYASDGVRRDTGARQMTPLSRLDSKNENRNIASCYLLGRWYTFCFPLVPTILKENLRTITLLWKDRAKGIYKEEMRKKECVLIGRRRQDHRKC